MLHTQAYTEYLLYVFKTMFSQHIWHIKPKKKLLLILYKCISSNCTLPWMRESVSVLLLNSKWTPVQLSHCENKFQYDSGEAAVTNISL